MVEELKRLYNEKNMECESILGNYSYRLLAIQIWLHGGKIIGLDKEFKEEDIFAIIIKNQETNKQIVVEYDKIHKMEISENQIKFKMKDRSKFYIKF